jgi:hypothetical protein
MTLRLNGSTSGYVEIDAPATAGSNTLVLPTGNGSNGQVLSTNGSGALSWAQGGRILQVVTATSTGVTSTSSNTDLPGLSASITVSANSRVIVHGSSGAYGTGASSDWYGTGRLRILNSGNNVLAITEHMGIVTPNVQQTYQHTIFHISTAQAAGTYTYKLNGTSTNGGTIQWNREGSLQGWLMLMEVAA